MVGISVNAFGEVVNYWTIKNILITQHEPTLEMKREAALAGEHKYSETVNFPKIQILSIKDWFKGKTIKLPSETVNPFKKAQAKIEQVELFKSQN